MASPYMYLFSAVAALSATVFDGEHPIWHFLGCSLFIPVNAFYRGRFLDLCKIRDSTILHEFWVASSSAGLSIIHAHSPSSCPHDENIRILVDSLWTYRNCSTSVNISVVFVEQKCDGDKQCNLPLCRYQVDTWIYRYNSISRSNP